jgi:hypothetical protein
VIELAQEFHWPFGPKKVHLHPSHVGLIGQWKTVNDGRVEGKNSDEVMTIVLEDDIVVSPFYFLWLLRAINEYYTPEQVQLHRELSQAVADDILTTRQQLILQTTHVDDFYRNHAGRGEPLIIGLSLSKQSLDTVHFPADLEIRNHHSPHLMRYDLELIDVSLTAPLCPLSL